MTIAETTSMKTKPGPQCLIVPHSRSCGAPSVSSGCEALGLDELGIVALYSSCNNTSQATIGTARDARQDPMDSNVGWAPTDVRLATAAYHDFVGNWGHAQTQTLPSHCCSRWLWW